MTGSAFRAVAPVSAVYAAFRVQPSAYPPSTRKPDVAPPCRSAAKTKKEIKCLRNFIVKNFRQSKTENRCRRSKICWKPARKIVFIS